MRRQVTGSWRFGHGDMGYVHTALFVRDAAGLPVAPSADIPPRLEGDVPDCAGVIPPTERSAAGRQWVAWWHRLVGQAAREARQKWTPLPAGTDPDDLDALVRHRFAGRDDVFDPPDFGSLADMQPLQSAATGTFEAWHLWSYSQQAGAGKRERFIWSLIRDAAESAAADLGIPVGEVHGYVNVPDVEGLWSYLAGPGCALCSAAAARDPSAAGRMLREVFTSGHDGVAAPS
jgi:hypothetical protein